MIAKYKLNIKFTDYQQFIPKIELFSCENQTLFLYLEY